MVLIPPRLTDEEQKDCEGMISLEECHKALKTFKNNKSPGMMAFKLNFIKHSGQSLEALWLRPLTIHSKKERCPHHKDKR